MIQYQKLLQLVLTKGEWTTNRTKINTLTYFGTQSRYDLTKGFPLLTTKKMAYKAIFTELIWILSGSTNIKFLIDNNVHIWTAWPYQKYQQSSFYKNETISEFSNKIKNDHNFAREFGELGPVYGKQWRDFGGIDQIKMALTMLKTDPFSRRIIVSAWNPICLKQMLLPPCHCFFQLHVSPAKELSLHLYQRSADLFLGVPFNIASYALLTEMFAQQANLKAKNFIHTIGNAHIYQNHLEQIKMQLQRIPKPLPQLVLKKQHCLFDYSIADINLQNYQHYPPIFGEVAV